MPSQTCARCILPRKKKAPASDLDALLDQLRKSPELASTLASLLGAVTAGKQV